MLAGVFLYLKEEMMPSEEIAALGFLTAKESREDDCYRLVKSMTESTRAEDKGCLYYAFFTRANDSREFVLHERWQNGAAIMAHLRRLGAVYGPPAPGAPPGSLPAAIAEPFEKIQFIALKVVE
jgi:quinol monooxygenase YgiN